MNELGEVLSTARRAADLTQAQLADRAGMTQAALSRYEHGLRVPEDDKLEALADALGVTPRLLLHGGRARGAVAVDAHMRRRATAPATVWRRLEARLNMYRLHANLLGEEVQIRSESSVPTFDPIDTDPEAAARMTRMQWKLPMGPVRQMTRWLEAAGCLVVEEPFGTNRVDGMSQWIGGLPVMLINADAPTDRQRLTMAHELGHLVMHSAEVVENVEEQANEFAAEFLMPSDTIRAQLRNLRLERLPDLKLQWGVSMQALVERSYSLGFVTPEQRTRIYKTFSARRWRVHEPVSDQLPPEKPELTSAISTALRERGLDAEEIAQIAGFASPGDNRLLPDVHPGGLRIVPSKSRRPGAAG